MKAGKKQKKNNPICAIASPFILAVLAAIAVFTSRSGFLQRLDYRLYDLMLGLTKETDASENIVLVDIDDESLERIGFWPWSRDILGNALLRMKEFGARTAVFDIEYLSPTPKGVNENFESAVNETFANGEMMISQSIAEFAGAIERGDVHEINAQEKAEDLVAENIESILNEMKRNITSDISMDRDDFFARCIQFFGNTFLTVNFQESPIRRKAEEIQYIHNRFFFGNVEDPLNLISGDSIHSAGNGAQKAEGDFVPTMHRFASRSSGVGFTDVFLDGDGRCRRIGLLNHHDGKYAGQLAFAPLVQLLDVKSMERTRNSLVLHGAKMSENDERKDVMIPLDGHGRMLVNWLHGNYHESFTHVPAFTLYDLDQSENLIVRNLSNLTNADLTALAEDDRDYILNTEYFSSEYRELEKNRRNLLLKCKGFKENGDAIGGGLAKTDYNIYFLARRIFFEHLKSFTDSLAKISGIEKIPQAKELMDSVDSYLRDEKLIASSFDKAFCFIGSSADSSPDLCSTPFSARYANPGILANAANTILNQNFIREADPLWGILFCTLFIIIVYILKFKMDRLWKNILGLLYIIIPAASFVVLMIVLRFYVPAVVPLSLCIFFYIIELTLSFKALNGERKFLRSTFGAYVAPAVVNEIIRNPDRLKLEGENKNITALFSDVQKFSDLIENINSEGEADGSFRLVSILTDYLDEMGDTIMDCHGTIDKYVDDGISSLFGAPVDDMDHAYHACVASIRMIQAERSFNEENRTRLPIIKETGEPLYLHSRIGINTGRMLVGNMGTGRKFNYTAIGDNVSLASRLEQANKIYNSWILCSESTWKEANSGVHKGELVARRMDYIRAADAKKPIQIYNILGLKSEMKSDQLEAAALFNEGMKFYLKGSGTPEAKKSIEDLKTAYAYFKKARDCYPLDGSSEVFMRRCAIFITKGIPPVWDGVFTMTQK